MSAAVETPIKSGVSASDISDAELPVSQSEKESSDDLEGIEEARAELLAKLASAGISDEVSEETSEGKITSDNNKSQKSEAEESDNNKSQKSEAEKEEKAEKTEEEKKDIETDDHEQAKREMDKDNSQIPKDPDDSNGAPGVGGNPSSSASTQVKNPSSTDSSNFEKDNKMPRTKTYKRKFSTTTNGSDVKKKSKPKLFIPDRPKSFWTYRRTRHKTYHFLVLVRLVEIMKLQPLF